MGLARVCTGIGAGRACRSAQEKANIRRNYRAMSAASAIRLQIESALAARIPAALSPAPRVVRPVASTGIEALDEVLHGGLPIGALTELVGSGVLGANLGCAQICGRPDAGRESVRVDRRVECARSGFGSSGRRGAGAIVVGALRSGKTRGAARDPAFFAAGKISDARAGDERPAWRGLRRSPARRSQGTRSSRGRTSAAGDAQISPHAAPSHNLAEPQDKMRHL